MVPDKLHVHVLSDAVTTKAKRNELEDTKGVIGIR
jgi:hypothetical protein